MSVYCIADLHGRLDLLNKFKKDYLRPKDTVYVLGDCGDRGPDGWETIKAVYENPQFIYLKGNHEDMLIKEMSKYINLEEQDRKHYINYDFYDSLCYLNGGESTFMDWIKEENFANWINKINKLPLSVIYKNKNGNKIILSHAGYTYQNEQFLKREEYLWNREHFNDEPSQDMIDEDVIIVHGHTPIALMNNYLYPFNYEHLEEPKAFWYCDNHKVNIDAGAVFFGNLLVLDLDTFKEKIIF